MKKNISAIIVIGISLFIVLSCVKDNDKKATVITEPKIAFVDLASQLQAFSSDFAQENNIVTTRGSWWRRFFRTVIRDIGGLFGYRGGGGSWIFGSRFCIWTGYPNFTWTKS